MSVFGGDSWARDAQQRKRRLDDLMLPASASSSPSAPDSSTRLPSGKLACLVCPHRPVLDSPLMLCMHNKGARHIAAESRLREKELYKKHEISKRLALSSDASHSNSGKPHTSIRPTNMKEKPLIEETRWQSLKHNQAASMISMARRYLLIRSGRQILQPLSPMLLLLMFQWKISLEVLDRYNVMAVEENLLLQVRFEVSYFQIGKQKPKNARSKNFGSLLRAGNGMAMEDGTEMKMLNLTQTKMILTSVLADPLRRHSELIILWLN